MINEEAGLNITFKKRLMFSVFNLINHLSPDVNVNTARDNNTSDSIAQKKIDDEDETIHFSPEQIIEEINEHKKKNIDVKENATAAATVAAAALAAAVANATPTKMIEEEDIDVIMVEDVEEADEKDVRVIDIKSNKTANIEENKVVESTQVDNIVQQQQQQQQPDNNSFSPKRGVIVSPPAVALSRVIKENTQAAKKPGSSTCSSSSAASSCPSPLSSVASSSPSSPASDSFKMDRLLNGSCSKVSEQVSETFAVATGVELTSSKQTCVSSPN